MKTISLTDFADYLTAKETKDLPLNEIFKSVQNFKKKQVFRFCNLCNFFSRITFVAFAVKKEYILLMQIFYCLN